MDPLTILIIGAFGLYVLNQKKTQMQNADGTVPFESYPDGAPSAGHAPNVNVQPTTGTPVQVTTPNPDSPSVPTQTAIDTALPAASSQSGQTANRLLSERIQDNDLPDNAWLVSLLQRAELQGASFTPVKEQIQADIQTYQQQPSLVSQYQNLLNQVDQEESNYYNNQYS